jgi:hypothetical protein
MHRPQAGIRAARRVDENGRDSVSLRDDVVPDGGEAMVTSTAGEDGRSPRVLRTALYLDFDNLYSGLRRVDPDVAKTFANDPARLLHWLTFGEDDHGRFRRKFLVRDCYLNPQEYAWCRAQFVAAGFRVVDCPSLTQQGKSSADTHIVLDVVDALGHATRYDEFIICSADADFSPLMTKLRRHDRRTVMIAAGPYAAAYEAVCDTSLGPMQLVEAFASAPARDLQPGLGPVGKGVSDTDMAAAAEAIRQAVAESATPLPGATAAGAGQRAAQGIAAAGWGTTGGFSAFVRERLPELELVRNDSGGWLIDPKRHSVSDLLSEEAPDDVVARVCRVTRAPRLSSAQYAVLFEELSKAAPAQPVLGRLGVDVRERAAAAGTPVGRGAVNFVVQGLLYAGADPRQGQRTPAQLARSWRENVRTLCRQAGMELSSEDELALDSWILSGLRSSAGNEAPS